MKITVSEALRLKNELSQTVKTLQYKTHSAPLGITKEDSQVINDEGDSKKFAEAVDRLTKALKFSEEINSKIASFNKEHSIDNKVRSMQNDKLLLSVYENALPRTKATKTTKFETVLGNRKAVVVEYSPAITSTDVKSKISHFKTKYRTTQNEIEKLNQGSIELTFSHDDVESLASAE